MKNKFLALFFLLKVLLMLAGCASGPPENVEIATNNRLVMQVIDGRFYKWLEIKNSNGSTDTYMLEPQNGFYPETRPLLFTPPHAAGKIVTRQSSALCRPPR